MKSKLIALLMVFAFASSAIAQEQLPIDEKTGKVVFTDVIKVEGKTKDELYKKSKQWIVTTLKSSDNMIELNGDDADDITGTGNILFSSGEIQYISEALLNFKFNVVCKDNRLKYSVENFLLVTKGGYKSALNPMEEIWPHDIGIGLKKKREKFKESAKAAVKKSIDSLINDFTSSIKEEEEEW